jgi:hypothetical protein
VTKRQLSDAALFTTDPRFSTFDHGENVWAGRESATTSEAILHRKTELRFLDMEISFSRVRPRIV